MPTPRPAYHAGLPVMTAQLPHLRPAEAAGLALWVTGTMLAGSACQSTLIAAL